jgi:elongator complex protein 4
MSFRRYAQQKPSSDPPSQINVGDETPSGILPGSTPAISTGTSTLDSLLSPLPGLPVSSVLLVEELGTGNYSGVVLRQYVAEGVVQGNMLWIGAVGEIWWRGVPAVGDAQSTMKKSPTRETEEKMKIAWRYGVDEPKTSNSRSNAHIAEFCHSFDISQQLPYPGRSQVIFSPPPSTRNPYQPMLTSLLSFLETVPKLTPVRLILPDFLNPLIYGPECTQPSAVLRFLHTLQALVRTRVYCTAMISLSTSFYPRDQALTCWIEHLCSHIVHLCPLPRSSNDSAKGPQGLVKVHKGGLRLKEMAYRVGRRGMVLEEWSLPPLEDQAPRVKQGFVIEKEINKLSVTNSPISGVAKKDLEF